MTEDNDTKGKPALALSQPAGESALPQNVAGPPPLYVTDFSISYTLGAMVISFGQPRPMFSPEGEARGLGRAWQVALGMSPQHLKTLHGLAGRAVRIYEERHGTITDFLDASAAEEK
jgi:hypothetical protein